MQAFEFAGKNRDFAGERQFDDARLQEPLAQFPDRIEPTQPTPRDKKRNLPKTDGADGELSSSYGPS